MHFVDDITPYVGLYSHGDATRLEITQLGASACGATALMNVLLSLRIVDRIHCGRLDWSVCTLRSRDYSASLPQYLASRSVAGCTGQDLVDSMVALTCKNNLPTISGEFIAYNDVIEKHPSCSEFIRSRIREGKAVVATLNLQLIGNDAWHHQLVYGVDAAGGGEENVYCLNPHGAYPMDLFESFLSTRSVLLIRRQDVLDRVTRPIIHSSEMSEDQVYTQPEWRKLRVREQIERMKEDESVEYLVIPASYRGGFAVFSKTS